MKKLLRTSGAALSHSRSSKDSAGSNRWIALIVLALAVAAASSGSVRAVNALPAADAVTQAATTASALTVTRPSSVAAGHVLVAVVEAGVTAGTPIGTPTGWVLIRRDSNAPGYSALTQALYYKVAGPSEPTTYTWSLPSPAAITGGMLDFAGLNTSTPVDAHGGSFKPAARSVSAPSVTTTAPGDVIVGFFGVSGRKSFQAPSGMTEEFDIRATNSAEGSAYVQGS